MISHLDIDSHYGWEPITSRWAEEVYNVIQDQDELHRYMRIARPDHAARPEYRGTPSHWNQPDPAPHYVMPVIGRGRVGGNWCGWGWTQEGKPIDEIDSYCREHDLRHMWAEDKRRAGMFTIDDEGLAKMLADLRLVEQLATMIRARRVPTQEFPAVYDMIIAFVTVTWVMRPPVERTHNYHYYPVRPYPLEPGDGGRARAQQLAADFTNGSSGGK